MINGKSKRLTTSTSYPSNQSVMQSTWGIRATAKVQRAISKVALFSVGSFEGRKRPQQPQHVLVELFVKIIHKMFGQTKEKKKFTPCSFNPKKRTRWTFSSVSFFSRFLVRGSIFRLSRWLTLPKTSWWSIITILTVSDFQKFRQQKSIEICKTAISPPIWTSKKRCEHTL